MKIIYCVFSSEANEMSNIKMANETEELN